MCIRDRAGPNRHSNISPASAEAVLINALNKRRRMANPAISLSLIHISNKCVVFRVMAESAQALQQGFRHHPQCAVELNVSVNACLLYTSIIASDIPEIIPGEHITF